MKEKNDQLYQELISKALSDKTLCLSDEVIYTSEGDDFGGLYEYEAIERRLRPRVVNLEYNKSLEKTVPCIRLNEIGLLVIFYVDLCMRNNTNIRFVVTNYHLTLWKVTKDTVIQAALKNLSKLQ